MNDVLIAFLVLGVLSLESAVVARRVLGQSWKFTIFQVLLLNAPFIVMTAWFAFLSCVQNQDSTLQNVDYWYWGAYGLGLLVMSGMLCGLGVCLSVVTNLCGVITLLSRRGKSDSDTLPQDAATSTADACAPTGGHFRADRLVNEWEGR